MRAPAIIFLAAVFGAMPWPDAHAQTASTSPSAAPPPSSAPSSTPPAGAPPAPPPAKAPAGQELMYQGEATSILGRRVRGPTGEAVGRIVDVLVDGGGVPRAAVIDFGGFMGVGNRKVAVAWHTLKFAPAAGQETITLNLTEDQIADIPDFKRPATPTDPPVTVAVPPPKTAAPP